MVERLNKLIAAVGVAREVGLANACDDRFRFNLIGINRCQGQKQDIAAGDKGAGQAGCSRVIRWHRDAVTRQAAHRQRIQHRHIQHFMSTGTQLQGQVAGNVNLFTMTLTVIKGHTVHFIITLQSLNQTGGGVLPTAKHHNSAFHEISQFKHLRLW